MKASEYIDAAKHALNLPSDYALAKALGIPNANIVGIRNETRHIPVDVAFRIAITLQIDPAQVVADLEAQRAKNPKKREFWQGFTSRAAHLLIAIACTLALSFTAICGSAETRGNGPFRRRLQCA